MRFSSNSICNPSLAPLPYNEGDGQVTIEFPLKMDWYNGLPCTKFRSLEHRKVRTGLQHEFILLGMNDGSVCRMERMGDPAARFDVVGATECVAHDLARCYRLEDAGNSRSEDSELVTHVVFPYDLDLLHVLRICRAIHECDKSRNYTPQAFNCYFFALAIQSCLVRSVARWEVMLPDLTWGSAMYDTAKILSAADPLPTNSGIQIPLVLRACYALGQTYGWPQGCFMHEARRLLVQKYSRRPGLDRAVRRELWHSSLSSIPRRLLNEHIHETMVEILTPCVEHFGDDQPLEQERSKCITLLLDLVTLAYRGQQQPEVLELTHDGSIVDNTVSRDQMISEMDYRPNGVMVGQPVQSLTITQWILVCWCHLKVILSCTLANLILRICGEFMPGSLSPPVPVEKHLKHIVVRLEQLNPVTLEELRWFSQEIRALLANENTVWNQRPWGAIEQAVAVCPPPIAPPKGETMDLTVLAMGYTQPKNMSVSMFQRHIWACITSQGELVQSVWLGSARKIQLDIRQKLSQIWAQVCDDQGIGASVSVIPSDSAISEYVFPFEGSTNASSIAPSRPAPPQSMRIQCDDVLIAAPIPFYAPFIPTTAPIRTKSVQAIVLPAGSTAPVHQVVYINVYPGNGPGRTIHQPSLQFFGERNEIFNIVIMKGVAAQTLACPFSVWFQTKHQDVRNRCVPALIKGQSKYEWFGDIVVLKYDGPRRARYKHANQADDLSTIEHFFRTEIILG